MSDQRINTPLTVDFPELAHLSREDLEDMLSDHTYFQSIFHSLSSVKAMYQSQGELGLANESIASNNLALQEQLYALRSRTKDAFDEARALEARWKELEKEQRDVYQRFNPQFLLMRLRHSTTSQDDKSEALAAAFVQQSGSDGTDTPSGSSKEIDDFIREFKDVRKTYHKRVIWGDRWTSGQVAWRDD